MTERFRKSGPRESHWGMQDRTIDNALRVLCKPSGVEGWLASVLLELRGSTLSVTTQVKPMRRGEASRFVMDAPKGGSKTCPPIADILALERPTLARGAVLQRVYNGCYG